MHYSKHILKNGLRVIVVPMKGHPTVTVMTLVEAGSKYETKAENGLSHFLEHMCFKGTAKRPSALAVTKELDSIGAAYNAFTSHEWTGYYAKCATKQFDIALDVVSDIYLNSTLPEVELQKEKGVIIEEIHMYEDLPQRKVQDVFTELLYGDTPAGWNIAGTTETVSSFNRTVMADYRARQYVSQATAVIIAGDVDEQSTLRKVEERFFGASSGAKDGKHSVVEHQIAPAIRLFYKETDQAHLVLGVRTFDVYDERNPILKVLSAVLGGGMSSRLFQKIRDEMGAAYYIGAGAETFTDHGYFEVAAGVAEGRVLEVLSAIRGELDRLSREDVSADELKKAKDYLIGSMYLSLETSDAVADLFGYQEIMRKPILTPDEIRERLEKVTAKEIKTLASEFFVPERLNLAMVGKFRNEQEFLPILTT